MTIETLTGDERAGLETVEPLSTDWRVQKALRSIDDLTAALATAETDRRALVAQAALLKRERDEARALVPSAGDGSCELCGFAPSTKVARCLSCRGEVTRLTRERDEARDQLDRADAVYNECKEKIERQRANVTRLTKERDEALAEGTRARESRAVWEERCRMTSERLEEFESRMAKTECAHVGDVTRLTQERDEARAANDALRDIVEQARGTKPHPLEAEVTRLTRERDEAHEQTIAYKEDVLKLRNMNSGLLKYQDSAKDCMRVLEADVARLTAELRRANADGIAAHGEVKRLQEALAAAERRLKEAGTSIHDTRTFPALTALANELHARAETAEARVKELEAERDTFRIEHVAALQTRVRELEEALIAEERRHVATHRATADMLLRAEAAEAHVRELEEQERNTVKLAVHHLERAMLAEARVKELEAACTSIEARAQEYQRLYRRSESELAQLRERVARALVVAVYGDTVDGLRVRVTEALRGTP